VSCVLGTSWKEHLVHKSIFNRFMVGAALIACVALGAGVLAGCGGSDSSTTAGASGASGASGGTPLSQDEFVSQANAACKEANDKINALKPPSSSDLSAVAPILAQEVAIFGDTVAKLTAITPPSDQQAQYDAWLSDIKGSVAQATELAAVAKTGDTAKAQALAQKLQTANDKANAGAKDLGLTECAKNAQPSG
jgi:hypothetical protein